MSPDPAPPRQRGRPVARLIERTIFGSRWLMAPFYLGLILGQLALLAKFVQYTWKMLAGALDASGTAMIVSVLSLIDLGLMANLLLIVILAGYETFVSRLELDEQARLDWMGQVGFGDLKLKLMASIVAISAIQVLEEFMEVSDISDRDLAWMVGILLVFVVCALLLALMDRVSPKH